MQRKFEFNWLVEIPNEEKKTIEKIAKLEQDPIIISGQRSSIYPTNIFSGYKGIQIKGHLFRATENGSIFTSPTTEIYQGRGNPNECSWINKDGDIEFMKSSLQPNGFMLFNEIEKNIKVINEFKKNGLPIVESIGYGKVLNKIFAPGLYFSKKLNYNVPNFFFNPLEVGCFFFKKS